VPRRERKKKIGETVYDLPSRAATLGNGHRVKKQKFEQAEKGKPNARNIYGLICNWEKWAE